MRRLIRKPQNIGTIIPPPPPPPSTIHTNLWGIVVKAKRSRAEMNILQLSKPYVRIIFAQALGSVVFQGVNE